MEGILEGILFVVGNEGITKERLLEILEIDEEKLDKVIENLKNEYSKDTRGLDLEIYSNKYKLVTKKEHKPYYEKLVEKEKNDDLSQAALETLAIIAYNEPVTVQNLDTIRGVNSREMVRRLMAKGFVKEVGKSEGIGRPTLYATTRDFLDYFGLSSKEELPKFEQIKNEIVDDTDLYESTYKENE